MSKQKPQVVIVKGPPKSTAMAVALAFFFGPLGLLYCAPLSAVVLTILTAIVAVVTLGVGLVVMWPLCMLWAVLATIRIW
jgi:hypothetical protein